MAQLIRSEALRGYPELVLELKGDPQVLLAKQGLSGDLINQVGAMISYRRFIALLEDTAAQQRVMQFMHVYSPGILIRLNDLPDTNRLLFSLEISLTPLPDCRQTMELNMGLAYQIITFLSEGRSKPYGVVPPSTPIEVCFPARLISSRRWADLKSINRICYCPLGVRMSAWEKWPMSICRKTFLVMTCC